jgi:hypothetical protein
MGVRSVWRRFSRTVLGRVDVDALDAASPYGSKESVEYAAKSLMSGKCAACGADIRRDVESEESVIFSCTNPKCGRKAEIIDDIGEEEF